MSATVDAFFDEYARRYTRQLDELPAPRHAGRVAPPLVHEPPLSPSDRSVYTRCRADDNPHSLGRSGGCVWDYELAPLRDGRVRWDWGLSLDRGVVRDRQRCSR